MLDGEDLGFARDDRLVRLGCRLNTQPAFLELLANFDRRGDGVSGSYWSDEVQILGDVDDVPWQVGAQILAGDVDRALLVGASRAEDLVDYTDEDASLMYNFGSGASAFVLEREAGDRSRAAVLGHDTLTDGSFSRDVIMPAGGSVNPPGVGTVEAGLHRLTVPDPEDMGERLGAVTLENFLTVTDGALAAADRDRSDVDFVALTHMKRSFTETLLEELGLDAPNDHHYLDQYGHVQSVDQAIALDEGLERDKVSSGDIVLFLAAGTGYTWAASVLRWKR